MDESSTYKEVEVGHILGTAIAPKNTPARLKAKLKELHICASRGGHTIPICVPNLAVLEVWLHLSGEPNSKIDTPQLFRSLHVENALDHFRRGAQMIIVAAVKAM